MAVKEGDAVVLSDGTRMTGAQIEELLTYLDGLPCDTGPLVSSDLVGRVWDSVFLMGLRKGLNLPEAIDQADKFLIERRARFADPADFSQQALPLFVQMMEKYFTPQESEVPPGATKQ